MRFRPRVIATVAKCEIITVALRCCTCRKSAEDYICDALRGENVTTYNSSFGGWGEEGVRGDDDVNRGKAALVERDVGMNESAEAVDDCRVGNGSGGVKVACQKAVSSG